MTAGWVRQVWPRSVALAMLALVALPGCGAVIGQIEAGLYSPPGGAGSLGAGGEAWNESGRVAAYATVAARPDASDATAEYTTGYLLELEADKYFLQKQRKASAEGGRGNAYKGPFVRARASAGLLGGDDRWMSEGALGVGWHWAADMKEFGQSGRRWRLNLTIAFEVSLSRLSLDDSTETYGGGRFTLTFPLIGLFASDIHPR